MDTSRYTTTAGAAERLAISQEQIISLIHCGRLRAVNVSATDTKPRWRIALADLERFISERTHKPTPAATRRRSKVAKPVVDYFA